MTWVAISTSYFGNKLFGFSSRKKAELYVESALNKSLGYSKRIREQNITIYIENSNDEDVYVQKVDMIDKNTHNGENNEEDK